MSEDKQEQDLPLFREQAVRHRTRALFGEVVLAAPLSTWLITGFLILIVGSILAFGVFGHIDGQAPWAWVFGHPT